MKKMLRLFFVVMSLFIGVSSYAQSTPDLFYFKFDNLANGKIKNYASNPPIGCDSAVVSGSLLIDSTGMCGHALVGSGLSSSTDFVNTNWATSFSGSWTISFWTKNIASSATLFYIFGDINASTLRCFTNGVAGANNWVLRGPVTDVYITNGAVMSPTMTTFVYDTLTDNIKGYLNGVLVTTVAQNPNISISGTGPFKVGSYGSNTGMPAQGLMDEFRIYTRALSDAEVLELLIPNSFDTIYPSACTQYTSPSGQFVWSQSGTYHDTLVNSMGCDSIITIELTIPIVDVEVTQNGITLMALDGDATSYQWVDCNNAYAPINGATNRIFTPVANGSYAVIVTKVCSDTSACFNVSGVGVEETQAMKTVIFPNPASTQVAIISSEEAVEVTITDLQGKVIERIVDNKKQYIVNTENYPSGTYWILIRKENCVENHKITIF